MHVIICQLFIVMKNNPISKVFVIISIAKKKVIVGGDL